MEHLGRVTGELVAELHTAMTRGPSQRLSAAIRRFVHHLRHGGASKKLCVDSMERLLDQAVAGAELPAMSAARRIADGVCADVLAECIDAYDTLAEHEITVSHPPDQLID